MSRSGLVAGCALLALVAMPAGALARGAERNPFGSAKLFVDPDSDAARQADSWRLTRPFDAMAMDRIGNRSQADWFGDWNTDIRGEVESRVTQIVATGSLPVLVAYNIPRRDCGGPSAGGARSPRAYRHWIRGFARGISRRPAAVVLEPDALAGMDCLRGSQRRTRVDLLRRAVRRLERRPAISVYIDAGHTGWQRPRAIADRLRRAGVARARGFALNVSAFQTTQSSLAYGRQIARLIGKRHFVVDTSRNGLGPSPDAQWCNPPGRGLGAPPTAATTDPLADAYLWIKRPGESDGSCNGGPPAGAWWADYALGLAQRAQG